MVSALLATWFCTGCGGGQQGAASIETRPLEESRALEIVARVVTGRGFQVTGPTKVDLGGEVWLECDLGVAGERMVIEYLTEQDRRRSGDIPPPAPGSKLHVIPARFEPSQPGLQGDPTYVFVIDDRKYVYHHNPTSDRRADVTLAEVEDRLRRDLIDFLTWYESTRADKD